MSVLLIYIQFGSWIIKGTVDSNINVDELSTTQLIIGNAS